MTDVVKINGTSYNVLVTELSENFTILYSENTGRTISVGARMSLDPLGSFVGHKITFKRRKGYEQKYDELFDYLLQPRFNGLMFELPHGQGTIKYEGYVSNGERALKRIDADTGKVYWDKFSVNIVAMEAQVTP